MKHANNFDFLRFLFAFGVVIGHTIILSNQPEFQNSFFAAMPAYGVLGFFIISGFLVFSSYERLKDLKKYFLNRAKRIFPAYFFVVLFFAFLLFIFSGVALREFFSTEWLKYVGANLLFMNFLQPCINFIFNENKICAVNGSLWTIKVELMFYLTVPLIFYLIKNKRLLFKNIILILIYFLSTGYFNLMHFYGKDTLAAQIPGFLNYFVTGILFYLNKDFFKKYIYYFLGLAIFIIFIEKVFFQLNIFAPFAYGILIFWFAFLDIPLKKFAKYGDFSYGIYLVHFPIVQIFIQAELYEKYSYYAFAMSTFLVLFFSVIIWKLIEQPVLKRKSIRIFP